MKFKNLDFDPARNPAVLDTATWDAPAVCRCLNQLPQGYVGSLVQAAENRRKLPTQNGFTPYDGSLAGKDGKMLFLAGMPDRQQIFVELAPPQSETVLGTALHQQKLDSGCLRAYAASAQNLDRFFRKVAPKKGPLALGSTPRLGIGVRMTTSCWPAILKAMDQKNFSSNMIQNSVRELNLMPKLLEAGAPEKNYACGFGTIETGYTGSTFEGLWVYGVLEGLKYPKDLPYGADADHIQVKRDPQGLDRAKRVIDSGRYYTFYTIDMADILGYQAMLEKDSAKAIAFFGQKITDSSLRKEIAQYHQQGRTIAGIRYQPDEAALGRLVGKFWDSLRIMEELAQYINSLKDGQKFDLEFAMDEHPPEVPAFDCLTTNEEVLFVLLEIQRRGLPVTHIAPNFGAEKGLDYRCPDGLDGLEKRILAQFGIAEEFGVMLDFHSADDLTAGPRRVIQKATGGKHHFKISPMLQLLYAEVLSQVHPDLFQEWWQDAQAYARREADAGSAFAQQCLKDFDPQKAPSRHDLFFHHYSFAFVGKRDAGGQFLHRHRFYDLSPAFYQAYEDRLVRYLSMLAEELF
jgi:hypothetical protein